MTQLFGTNPIWSILMRGRGVGGEMEGVCMSLIGTWHIMFCNSEEKLNWVVVIIVSTFYSLESKSLIAVKKVESCRTYKKSAK